MQQSTGAAGTLTRNSNLSRIPATVWALLDMVQMNAALDLTQLTVEYVSQTGLLRLRLSCHRADEGMEQTARIPLLMA